MKIRSACVFVLALTCGTLQAADDVSPRQRVKRKAEEINNALMKEDFAKVVDLTHPRIVELMGGRDKMISRLKAGSRDMRSKGFAIRPIKVKDPSDFVTAGSELFVVVPFHMEMKAPGGRIRGESFVIGVSTDQGKTWVFVNGDLDIKQLKQVLPELPEELKLPARQKPIVERD